ncbi:MAG TPA: chemotaxis protein CheB, partial [Polyangiaceae bacterium]|nr:chemotaxis protein CheB [Polyangiaceae bacterium]
MGHDLWRIRALEIYLMVGDGVEHASFHVVGIGASAGGLEALERFFDSLPEKTGMAFVIVQHLSPDFRSLMDELLARHTSLPIHLVEDGMQVERDHVYLIPPKKEMIISGGRLLLSERDRQHELTLP